MAKVERIIGKLPVHRGAWVQGTSYSRMNQVTMLGSSFQSKIDNNTQEPATVVNNDLVVGSNWDVVANGTAAYLAGSKIAQLEQKMNGFTVVFERGNISTTTGANTVATNGIRTKELCDITDIKSANYITPLLGNYQSLYYDVNKAFIGYSWSAFDNTTFPSAKYIRWSLGSTTTVLDYNTPSNYINIVLDTVTNSIADIESNVSVLHSDVVAIDYKTDTDFKYIPVDLSKERGWYNTFGEVGSVASMVFTASNDYKSIILDVKKGDVYIITGAGGNSPRLWAFIDPSNKILSVSASDLSASDLIIKAPADCRLVVNTKVYLTKHSLFKKINLTSNINWVDRLVDNNMMCIIQHSSLASIIHSWGFIGDSLASGYTEYTAKSDYNYSWGQRMCKLLGTEGYNFSYGGQTSGGWISTQSIQQERCWAGAQTNLKQAYIIALGTNDSTLINSGTLTLGDINTDVDISDYNNNAATFAGNYCGIIQRLRSIRPNSPIFVANLPCSNLKFLKEINTIIEQSSTKFSNVYLIDRYKYWADWTDTDFKKYMYGNHLNYIGYQYEAYQMSTIIDSIIRHNFDKFANIGTITYDK